MAARLLHWLSAQRPRIMVFALFLALPVAWYFTAYPRGMLMAYIDHARGHYEEKRYGLPFFFEGDDRDQLRQKYGVTV